MCNPAQCFMQTRLYMLAHVVASSVQPCHAALYKHDCLVCDVKNSHNHSCTIGTDGAAKPDCSLIFTNISYKLIFVTHVCCIRLLCGLRSAYAPKSGKHLVQPMCVKVQASLKRRYIMSALLGAWAVMFRQTNAVWICFIIAVRNRA